MLRVILGVFCVGIAVAASSSDPVVALDAFNEWLASGAAAGGSTVEPSVVYLRGTGANSKAEPLRLRLQHTDASLAAQPKLSLPLTTHVLGLDFVRTRPYYPKLVKLLPTNSTEDVLQFLTFALMTEFALWDASPLRPWCRLLLMEPKSIGLSTPPILWPKELLEELEPRLIMAAVNARRKVLESFAASKKSKQVALELEKFVNGSTGISTSDARQTTNTFKMSSPLNYLRARSIVESSALWTAPGGLSCLPFANLMDAHASTDPNVASMYMQQTLKEPLVRRIAGSAAYVEDGVLWTFHPHHRYVLFRDDVRVPTIAVDLAQAFAVDEYLATFGRLPARIPWELDDCQLTLFSKGLSRERNKIKSAVAISLENFLHHYACLKASALPVHGLVSALISVLPKDTPSSVEHCVDDAVKSNPPIDDDRMGAVYRSMILCLRSATWDDAAQPDALLVAHRVALRESIALFQAEQFKRSRSLEADKAAVVELNERVVGGGSTLERLAATTLRMHRKEILLTIQRQLESDVLGPDDEDIVEL